MHTVKLHVKLNRAYSNTKLALTMVDRLASINIEAEEEPPGLLTSTNIRLRPQNSQNSYGSPHSDFGTGAPGNRSPWLT